MNVHSLLKRPSQWQICCPSPMEIGKHKDLRPTEVTKSEQRVQRTIDAINGFMKPI